MTPLCPTAEHELSQLLQTRARRYPAACVGVVNQTGEAQLFTSKDTQDVTFKGDSVWWAASCTKVVTGLACGQLIEQGKVQLDAPLNKILPELDELGRITESGEVVQDTSPLTLRMLLSHTAGLGYHHTHDKLAEWACHHPDKFGASFLNLPRIAQPGQRFYYGTGVDWAGRLIERISGMSLGAYCERHIFKPLGIHDSTFDLQSRPDMVNRLVPMSHYLPTMGTYALYGGPVPFAHERSIQYGGAGLFTTPEDFMRLLVPLIRGGMGSNGARILKQETMQFMFEDHLALQRVTEGVFDMSDTPLSGLAIQGVQLSRPDRPQGQGLTFAVSKEKFSNGRPKGTAAWFGLSHTEWCAAPGKVALAVLQQTLPFGDPSFFELVEEVEKIIWRDVEGRDLQSKQPVDNGSKTRSVSSRVRPIAEDNTQAMRGRGYSL